jgi:Fic family protein
MVTLRKKTVRKKTYYYLEHTYRAGNSIRKKETYLGDKVPENLGSIKKAFLAEIYKERWYPLLDRLHEAYSKESKSMPKSLFEKELRTFSIKFTYDTSRIEGSTLTLRETADLLERGITPKEKPLGDVKEAEAHEKLFYEMLAWGKDLSMQTILYWHKRLLESTKPDIAGKLRQYQVAISGSKFMPPSPVEVYPMFEEFSKWYVKNKGSVHPVELAALVHLKFVTIHPFGDGNGRISRLLMNFVLNKKGFPMLNIPYTKRASYYHALERSQTTGNEDIFVQWFFRRYIKEHKKYLK